MMTIDELLTKRRFRIVDDSEYVSEFGNNGGCYSYWEEYINKNGLFEVRYGTSAEFEFCPVCGDFGHHEECVEFKRMSSKELIRHILECMHIRNNPDRCLYFQVYLGFDTTYGNRWETVELGV